MLLLMAFNCLSVIARKSVTNDENIHIPAGYYHLVVGDFQFNNPHPPPPKMLGALPLLFIQPDEMSEDRRDELKNEDDFERAAINHFWASNDRLFESISFWTRVPMIADAALLGLAIFYFARRLFGARAAALAVALYTLEPTVLAHGLGTRFEIMAASIKKWCVGSPIQAVLDATEALIAEHGVGAANVQRVRITMPGDRMHIVDNRSMPDVCVQHMTAVMLLDKTVTFRSAHDQARMKDPATLRERAKVQLIPDEALSRFLPTRAAKVDAFKP